MIDGLEQEASKQEASRAQQRPAGIDIRDLTLVGMFFGALSIGIIISAAIALHAATAPYMLQPLPHFLMDVIDKRVPALVCALPVVGIAWGFFKLSQCFFEVLGIPFSRRREPDESAAVNANCASLDHYPCSADEFQSRLRGINRLSKLAVAAWFAWVIPALFACFVAYDMWVGSRTNGLTDVLLFVVAGLLSFGPPLYLDFLATRPQALGRYKLLCPACSHALIDACADQVSQTKCCPGCGAALLSG